jgi:hypothetical protein
MLPLIVLMSLIGVGVTISRAETAASVNPTSTSASAQPRVGEQFTPGPRSFVGPSTTAKREVLNFADITPQTRLPEIDRDRFGASMRMDGEKPFAPERVTPASAAALDAAARPKTVDELRVASNPKTALPGKIAGHAMRFERRGVVGSTTAHVRRVAETSRSGGARSNVDRGALTGAVFEGMDSSRRDGVPVPLTPGGRSVGGAYANAPPPMLRRSGDALTIPSGAPAGDRGSDLEDMMRAYREDLSPADYSISVDRTGNVGSSAMGLRARPGDMGGWTSVNKRAIATPHPRTYGSVQIVNPARSPAYDPRDTARTTIKETTIHDTGDGFLRAPAEAVPARCESVAARMTGRAAITDGAAADGRGHAIVGAGVTGTATAFAHAGRDGTSAPATVKQTTTLASRAGNVRVDPVNNETAAPLTATAAPLRAHMHAERYGMAGRPVGDGYLVSPSDMPRTARGGFSTNFRDGVAAPRVPNQPDTHQVYTSVMGAMKESVLKGRAPLGHREILTAGPDTITTAPGTRDPALDVARRFANVEGQGRVQHAVRFEPRSDTRGAVREYAAPMDARLVADQLRGNPFATAVADAL